MDKKRTLIRDLGAEIGSRVTIMGWLHKKRLLGGLNFITLRDRSGIAQSLIEDKNEIEKLRGMQIGTVLTLTGDVVGDERAPGGAELHNVEVEVLSAVTDEPLIEVDKPIPHKSENLDSLFEFRVLNSRNLNEQKIFKIRADLVQNLRQFLVDNEFVEIDTPKLLAGATEGGAEVFKLDYYGKEATLAQSPQFYKQIMVGAFERVFEIGHAYRAELSATSRHLAEVTMLDIEMGFVKDHDEVINTVGEMTMFALRQTYEKFANELRSLNAPELRLPATASEIPRFSIAEIHELYFKETGTDVRDEKDLTPDEERFIGDYARKKLDSDLVFAKDFPLSAGKFYHKFNQEDGVVYWADLLFRGQELATCPLREENYTKMLEQMEAKGMDTSHPGYKYYLQAFQFGLPPHGGCGFGIDRLVQKTIGLKNVKEACFFPRDINRLAP